MTGEELIRDALSGNSKSKCKDGVKFISSDKTKYIDFKDIKSRKIRKEICEDITKWVTSDFVRYAKSSHLKTYQTQWNLNFSGCCQEILKVKDAVVDIVGFCDNVVLKDYIDFFFDVASNYYIKKSKPFYFSQMRKPWVLESFLESYDYVSRIMGTAKVKPKKKVEKDPDKEINERDIDNLYVLNWDRFVITFGVIVCINWLITKKDFSYTKAREFVLDICCDLYKKDKIKLVIESTTKYSPYPLWLKFQFARKFFNEIDNKLKIDIMFIESDGRLDFLRGSK